MDVEYRTVQRSAAVIVFGMKAIFPLPRIASQSFFGDLGEALGEEALGRGVLRVLFLAHVFVRPENDVETGPRIVAGMVGVDTGRIAERGLDVDHAFERLV